MPENEKKTKKHKRIQDKRHEIKRNLTVTVQIASHIIQSIPHTNEDDSCFGQLVPHINTLAGFHWKNTSNSSAVRPKTIL